MLRKFTFFLTFLSSWSVARSFDSKLNYSRLPDSYGRGAPDDMVDWSAHPCRRKCRDDGPPLTCRYGLTIETYASMSHACYRCPFVPEDCFRPHCVALDGNVKAVYTANRQVPGLAIEVCKGDRLLIDVTNGMEVESTTIHWHGMHQRQSPFMDGVPHVTQCPIDPGETFRYDFLADIAGTFIWHSHSGFQRHDGLFGSLIIRPSPGDDGHADLYDRDEHAVVLNEWYEGMGSSRFLSIHHRNRLSRPESIVVNGLGRNVDGPTDEMREMPASVFQVEQGYRYRFRVVHLGSHNCPVYVSIDDHPLLVISADGADVRPFEVAAIRMTTGERYDFVIDARREVGNYWLRVVGDNNCRDAKLCQFSVLRYRGAPQEVAQEPECDVASYLNDSRVLNPYDRGMETRDALTLLSLDSLEQEDDAWLMREPDHRFYLSYSADYLNDGVFFREGLYGIDQVPKENIRDVERINNISFQGSTFPWLTQPELIRPGDFCNETTASNCSERMCRCSHVLQVRLGSVVELITVDVGSIVPPLNHPMHLHGYYYRVVAMEKVNATFSVEQFKALDRAGKIRRKLKSAPRKDTALLPRGGYAILRFRADNPGYWLFHCHYEPHMKNGMALVFKVGEHEQFPKVPADFPKCGKRDAS